VFTPKLGEDEPIFEEYFFRWVETTNQSPFWVQTDDLEKDLS